MAAITWTQLQQACAIALTRQQGSAISTYDTLFVTEFPFATSYAEDRINQELPLLGATHTVTAAAITNAGTPDIAWSAFNFVSGGTAALTVPEQFSIVNSGTNVPYDRVSYDFIQRAWPVSSLTVAPSLSYQGGRYWATKDTTSITVAPTPDATYSATVTGLYNPVPISNSNTVTYVSTYYPDLLTAGCLVYLSGALTRNYGAQADEPRQAMSWEQQFQALLVPAREEERRRRGLKPDAPLPPQPPMPPSA